MKLRIKGNSLRFRLTQSEVTELISEGKITSQVEFSGSPFYYELALGNSTEPEARFNGSVISVILPETQAVEWAKTDQVGISGTSSRLSVLVEKDFTCLKSREGEDESDNFPNPLLGHSVK